MRISTTRRTRFAAVLVLWPQLSSAFAQADAKSAVAVQADVMVPMRDGVKLATDVYLPTARGDTLPTILERTPYGKGRDSATARYFAARGYAVVIQDTRGRFHSGGVWHMLADDGRDGSDTCEWIAKQPWANAKIGMIGTSYVGGTQH